MLHTIDSFRGFDELLNPIIIPFPTPRGLPDLSEIKDGSLVIPRNILQRSEEIYPHSASEPLKTPNALIQSQAKDRQRESLAATMMLHNYAQHPEERGYMRFLGQVQRVIDGDTLVAEVDLGFRIKTRQTFRLFGIDAPEHDMLSTEFLFREVMGKEVEIDSMKQDSFGRWISIIRRQDSNESINKALVDAGLAALYPGIKSVEEIK
jgi:endonuclease YncB( thermonuclease family)